MKNLFLFRLLQACIISFRMEMNKLSPFHNLGAAPAYFMAANMLGVTVQLPISTNLILIKPQMGRLTEASGTVVTEHGLVNVSWLKKDKYLIFSIEIPTGKKAKINFSLDGNKLKLVMNRKTVPFYKEGRYAVVELAGGKYSGIFE